ncbi:MAG: WecB/TagA/CpsF family glycosyltransferase [Acidimicrobiales bacterium]
MSIQLDSLSEDEAASYVVTAAARGQGGRLVNPNVDVLRQAVADPDVRRLVAEADLVLPDGMPLVWASRLQRSPLKARVPVSEAIATVCAYAARADVGVFLLGGSPGTAERSARLLAAAHPGLVAHHLCPPLGFEHDEAAMGEIIRCLEDAGPGVVFCAFGFPKQERLMELLAARFPKMWFVGSGATFSMVAGETPKAPLWMRKVGLEWLQRLLQEPKRLFGRYVVHDLPFALRLLGASARARWAPARSAFVPPAPAPAVQTREPM